MPKFKTKNSTQNSDKIIEVLNKGLADTLALKLQAKFFHWNIKGVLFNPLHELFDDIAGELESGSDLIAERVTQLGGIAEGTVKQVMEKNGIPEPEPVNYQGLTLLAEFVVNLASLANSTREGIEELMELGDQTGADILIEISRKLDKYLWFFEAHFQ